MELLLRIADETGDRPVLIPTTDIAALFVAKHAGALEERFRFPRVEPALVEALYSKKEMHCLARKYGVPTPEAFFPQSRSEACQFAAGAEYPVVIKAIHDRVLRRRGRVTKVIARNRHELIESYEWMEDPGAPSLMFQQSIPGRDLWMFNGYFDENSECKVGFTGRKLRQFPAYTGATTLGICMRNEAVASIAEQFMKALGYRGVLDIDYCYDARDGLYKVLDVNPRVGSTFRLFAGKDGAEDEVDVVRALYRDLTGQSVHAATAPEGRKWLVEDFDLLACLRYRRDGVLAMREWIGSYRGVRELACFALDDPLPVLAMLLDDMQAGLLSVFRGRRSRPVHGVDARARRSVGSVPIGKERECAERS